MPSPAALLLAPRWGATAAGFDCLIEPSQVVEVRASVEGLIAKVHVRRGDSVRRGQALVELQSRAERSAVESARFRSQMEGQIASARNRIELRDRKKLGPRHPSCEKQNIVSSQARDEAEAELRLAESELQAATGKPRARAHRARSASPSSSRCAPWSAPFNGVVVDRMLNPGDLAEAGTGRKAVLRLAQIDPLRVDVVLPAALFGQVRAGHAAAIVTALVGGSRYAAPCAASTR